MVSALSMNSGERRVFIVVGLNVLVSALTWAQVNSFVGYGLCSGPLNCVAEALGLCVVLCCWNVSKLSCKE